MSVVENVSKTIRTIKKNKQVDGINGIDFEIISFIKPKRQYLLVDIESISDSLNKTNRIVRHWWCVGILIGIPLASASDRIHRDACTVVIPERSGGCSKKSPCLWTAIYFSHNCFGIGVLGVVRLERTHYLNNESSMSLPLWIHRRLIAVTYDELIPDATVNIDRIITHENHSYKKKN